MPPARTSSTQAFCSIMGSQTHLNSSVALAELRQKFISARIGVSSPFDPPGQKPPAHIGELKNMKVYASYYSVAVLYLAVLAVTLECHAAFLLKMTK